jgi:hypothetical protein
LRVPIHPVGHASGARSVGLSSVLLAIFALFSSSAAAAPKIAQSTVNQSPRSVPTATARASSSQSGTLHLSIRSGRPSAYITASGTYVGGPLQLDVFLHNAAYGSANCPATAAAENAQVESETKQHGTPAASEFIYTSIGSVGAPTGSFSDGAYFGVGVPGGTYWVCGYVLGQQNVAASNGGAPLGVASAVVIVSTVNTAQASYVGTTSQGKMLAIAVQSGKATVAFFDHARCSDGGTTSGPATLPGLDDARSGRFAGRPAFSNLNLWASGQRYSLKYSVSGEVQGAAASGSISAVTAFFNRSGTQISTCSTGVLHWRAKKF